MRRQTLGGVAMILLLGQAPSSSAIRTIKTFKSASKRMLERKSLGEQLDHHLSGGSTAEEAEAWLNQVMKEHKVFVIYHPKDPYSGLLIAKFPFRLGDGFRAMRHKVRVYRKQAFERSIVVQRGSEVIPFGPVGDDLIEDGRAVVGTPNRLTKTDLDTLLETARRKRAERHP